MHSIIKICCLHSDHTSLDSGLASSELVDFKARLQSESKWILITIKLIERHLRTPGMDSVETVKPDHLPLGLFVYIAADQLHCRLRRSIGQLEVGVTAANE